MGTVEEREKQAKEREEIGWNDDKRRDIEQRVIAMKILGENVSYISGIVGVPEITVDYILKDVFKED